MHLVVAESGATWNGRFYRAGSCSVMYSREAQGMREAGAPIRLQPVQVPTQLTRWPVASLAILVAGGLGDRIQATPALRELAKQVLGGKIDFYSLLPVPEYDYLPYVGRVAVGVTPSWVLDHYEAVLTWEGVIDLPEAHTLPLHQLFAHHMGVTLTDEQPDFALQPWEDRLNPLRDLPVDKPLLGLHVGCHGPARAWPARNWLALAERMRDRFHVVLFGSAAEGPVWEAIIGSQRYSLPPPEWMTDLCGALPDVRFVAAALRGCAAFVGADSGLLHLAGTLGVPSVGLYGPFGYAQRGTNLSVAPLEVLPPEDRCPCFTHAQRGDELPCEREACLMMSALTVDMVAEKLMEVHEHGWKAARDTGRRSAGGTDLGGGAADAGSGGAGGADAAPALTLV